MRFAAVLAAVIAVCSALAVSGCGDSKPKGKKDATGASLEEVLKPNRDKAVGVALQGFAQGKREQALAELARLVPVPDPSKPAPGPGNESMAFGSGVPETPQVLAARKAVADWEAVIEELKLRGLAGCCTVKSFNVTEQNDSRATVRAVVKLTGRFEVLESKDLAFDLHWTRVFRNVYRSAPRADWELSDAPQVPVGQEKSPDE